MANSTSFPRDIEPQFWNEQIELATGRAFDWRCPFCGTSVVKRYHRAHIAPRGTGAGLVPGNIVLSCANCNTRMGHKHAWVWCEEEGIEYWHMIPILRTLAKIFIVPDTLGVSYQRLPIPSQPSGGTKSTGEAIAAMANAVEIDNGIRVQCQYCGEYFDAVDEKAARLAITAHYRGCAKRGLHE